jgi:hypothetical protein
MDQEALEKRHICGMKAANISELKQELINISPAQLAELCLRLARFKKENKELLTYLLFEAHDEPSYIHSIKKEIEEQFTSVHLTNLYLSKKTIRKILRICNKYARYSGSKVVEIEVLIYFCSTLKKSDIPFQNSPVLLNLYNNQLKKINGIINTLHEDLQYDYTKAMTELK